MLCCCWKLIKNCDALMYSGSVGWTPCSFMCFNFCEETISWLSSSACLVYVTMYAKKGVVILEQRQSRLEPTLKTSSACCFVAPVGIGAPWCWTAGGACTDAIVDGCSDDDMYSQQPCQNLRLVATYRQRISGRNDVRKSSMGWHGVVRGRY